MTFWTIFWYLTSHLRSKSHLTLQNVKMSNFWHHNRFCIQKNSPIRILRPTQLFNWDIWGFRWFLDRFGSFWGSMTSQKGSRFYNFKFLTSSSVFLIQNTYPCTFLGSKNHFIEFSGILGDFGTILGDFGGSWRHKMCQDLRI